MKPFLIAGAIVLAASPAYADPDTHQVTLPDGRVVMTITDANSQLVAPSTTLRVVVECDAGPTACAVVYTNSTSTSLLAGLFQGAVGDALRRPNRTAINNGNANEANAASEASATSEATANATGGSATATGGAGGAGGGGDNGNNAACGEGQGNNPNNGEGCD